MVYFPTFLRHTRNTKHPCFESGRGPYFLYSEDDHRRLEWKMTGFVKTDNLKF
jgi:hypothetical protein